MKQRKIPKIKITFPGLILIVVAFADLSGEGVVTLVAAGMHEMGHILAMVLFSVDIRSITLTPLGLEIDTKGMYKSFFEEMVITLSGCAVNFITFAFTYGFGGLISVFGVTSLLLGIMNILPIRCLDGGEALYTGVSIFCMPDRAERISRAVSFVTLIIMWVPATYIFLMSGYNYSLFIMSVWLFGKIFYEKK